MPRSRATLWGMGKKPRRARGSGSISERPDGRFDCAITLGTLLGKRRFKTTVGTYRDGERWIARMRRDYEQGGLSPDGQTLTVADYYPLWLSSVEDGISPKTRRDYADKFRLHIVPRHGKIKLRELTTPHVNALYRDMLASGASPRLIQYTHAVYRKALHDAEGWDLVRKNVAAFARPPKQESPERPVMSREEAGAFLREIRDDRLEALYLLAVTTGLRRGELLGLRWEDLDLDKGTLRVRGTKTAASRRPAVLPAPVAEALRRHRSAQLEEKLRAGPVWREHGMVFPTTVGTPQSGDNVLSRSLKPIMARAGLPTQKCFQYLRRSAATFLVLLKVHPRDAMRWLGHSNIQTTMNVYAQAPDEMQEETARLMADLLFGPDKPSIDRQTPTSPGSR